MPIASDQQVQNFVNDRTRPRCEQIRALLLACEADKAQIDDVYSALTQASPTWTDQRSDGPPHLMAVGDILAWNTFITQFIAICRGTLANDAAKVTACNDIAAQLPKVLQACVRGV